MFHVPEYWLFLVARERTSVNYPHPDVAAPSMDLGERYVLCAYVSQVRVYSLKCARQSIEAVSFGHFVIATFFYWPKLLLHVFIGSRAAAFADGEQRRNMDTRKSMTDHMSPSLTHFTIVHAETKVVNGILIASSIILSIVVGAVMYRFMKRQLRPVQDAEEAIEDIDEGAPLLRDFSPVRGEGEDRDEGRGRKNRTMDV